MRAFGEMVAKLWSQGFSGATAHLEHLGSRFCESDRFGLFCAYPKRDFSEDALESLTKICGCHSRLVANQKNGNGSCHLAALPLVKRNNRIFTIRMMLPASWSLAR